MESQIIPSDSLPDGLTALRLMSSRTNALRGAVAFATLEGARTLAEAFATNGPGHLHLIVRGAPVTEPDALTWLSEELEADVRVVMGEHATRFHPKLWLAPYEDGLLVLSGSGNLTLSGLSGNHEQFELLDVTEPGLIEQHNARFEAFVELSVPLVAVIGSPAWREWEEQERERRDIRERERQLDERLQRALAVSPTAVQEALYSDLIDLYGRTKAEVTLVDKQGRTTPYRAEFMRRKVEDYHRQGLVVVAVAELVRTKTTGFGHLETADRMDLSIEVLVLDESKPYHHLFSEATKQISRERLRKYYARRGAA